MKGTLELLSTTDWDQIGQSDKDSIFGIVFNISGWTNPIQNGSLVLAEINNGKETVCELIEGGFYSGNNIATVIISGDET